MSASLYNYFKRRELGISRQSVHGSLMNQLWGKSSGDTENHKNIDLSVNGMGIFGLKYSPDGKILVAACENNTISVVEPYSKRRLTRFNIHNGSCNTVTFFGDNYFCVASDDGIISIFDIRNLDTKLYWLHGVHEGWIKNVEYSPKDNMLVSSDLYGEVFAWDLAKPTICSSLESDLLLSVDQLLRMRLSPCGSSMYLSSVNPPGIIAIHSLDLEELVEDVGTLENHSTRRNVLTYGDNEKTSFDRSMARQELLCRPIRPTSKNYVEVYYSHQLEQGFTSEVETLNCLSMEIHPQNKCIVGTYQNLENSRPKSQITAVQNVCNYYRGPYEARQDFPVDNLLQEREDERRQLRRSKRLKCQRIDAQTTTLFSNVWKRKDLRHQCPPTQVCPPQRAEIPIARGQMTHYVGEMDMELSEYIQELSFSADARFVAAPDRHDVRIFAFDDTGSDYDTSMNNMLDDVDYHKGKHFTAFGIPKAKRMKELVCLKGHKSPVLSCAFSPSTMQIASGSLRGQLILHEPNMNEPGYELNLSDLT